MYQSAPLIVCSKTEVGCTRGIHVGGCREGLAQGPRGLVPDAEVTAASR